MTSRDDDRKEPVYACALPPPELRRRREEVLTDLRRRVAHIDETPAGFVFVFESSSITRAELDEFVQFEGACCAFIRMTVRQAAERFELAMEAAPEAKDFIRAELVDVLEGADACSCGGGACS